MDNDLYWSHGPFEIFDDKTRKIIKKVDNLDISGVFYPRSLARCIIATPCVMIKKECFVELGKNFNEDMRRGQDYCFWNVLAKSYPIGNYGETLVLVRNHKSNATDDVVAQLLSKGMMYSYIKKNNEYFGRIPILLKIAFFLSFLGCRIIGNFHVKSTQTVFSYLLYAIPWGLFRTYYFLASS